MSLATEQDLKDELRSSGDEYNDLEFNRYLRQANDRLASMVGRQFIETKQINFEEEQDVKLDFPALDSFDKVENVADNEIIDDANYTVDNTTATVTFDQSYVDDSFFEGLVLKFYYVPRVFKQLELYIATRHILEQETVVTGDEITGTQTDRLNQRITGMVNDINSRNTSSVQRGDNQNRGSEPPERLGGV